jgi:hypothetical protein
MAVSSVLNYRIAVARLDHAVVVCLLVGEAFT